MKTKKTNLPRPVKLSALSRKKELDFVNVYEDAAPLWEYCKENGWTDCTLDDFELEGVLQFFEGDPDMVKVDGETGYFFQHGETCFFYMDPWRASKAKSILQAFFGAYTPGITIGCEHFLRGATPAGVDDGAAVQNWDAWERIEDGIAWRGGAGYSYYIQDWTAWKPEGEEVPA